MIFDHTSHVRLWDAVIDELNEYDPEEDPKDGEDIKEMAFARAFGRYEIKPCYYCFACDYTEQITEFPQNRCIHCPLDWKTVSGYDTCCTPADLGLYNEYMNAIEDDDIDMAILIAKQIRDVPVKEGIDTI